MFITLSKMFNMFKTFMNFFILEKGININRWSSYLKKKKNEEPQL